MRLESSYEPNYFSIEDLIATNTTVPCRVEIQIPRLGDMDRGSQSEHLEPGRRLDLPLWLAYNLSKRHLIKPDFSKSYNESAREILKAEPNVVDLMKQEPYFYETGIHVGALVAGDEENMLKAIMHNIFQRRSKDVVNLSQADPSKEVLCRERLLSKEEKSLMLDGRQRWLEVENWLAGKVSSAELAAVSVSNYLKRKRPREETD